MSKSEIKIFVKNNLSKACLFLTFVIVNLYSGELNAQCSMCRAVVESDISGKGSGINNGIVYLMAFPYVLVALIGLGLFLKLRKDAALNEKV